MRLLHIFAALTLLLGSSLANAATLNFNGGAVGGCSLPASSSQYTCASLSMGSTDNVVIASGYGVTVNSDVNIGYNQGLSMSGTAALTVNRNLDISNVNPSNLKITGGSLTASGGNFSVGSQGGTVLVADISAASVSLGGTPVKVTGNITATGAIDISSKSTLNGSINGGSITTSSNVTISGSVKASGSVSIGSSSTITGPINGSNITTSSSVTITGDVTAVNSFSLGSGSNLKGATKAPVVSIDAANSQVQGDITASTSLSVGSGSQIKGNLTSPSIDLKASGLLVTGDVKASNALSIASGNGVNGDVEGGNVTLDSSNAYITGNALVDHITLGYHGRVQQTITCKTYTPSNPCSCVTNNSGWAFNEPMGPKCGPGTQAGPDHFQITHPPSALTCAAAPVTVTACADASCSSVYTGAVQVTLTPGGATAQINNKQPPTGMVTSSVGQTTAASNVKLGLTSVPATTGALVCKSSIDNSTTNCQMAFLTSALQISGVPRYAEEEGIINISAKQASSSNPNACVPLFAGQSKTLNLRCTYANPASGTLPARIQGQGGTYVALATNANAGNSCSVAGANIQLTFDANGLATPKMLYADVGALGLVATYASSSGSDSGLTMTGSGTVIVGPKYFAFSAISTPQQAGLSVVPVAPAKDIRVSALNAAEAATPNFGRESVAPTVLLGLTIIEPTFTGHAEPSADGSLGFSGGVLIATGMGWKEVGLVQFTASLNNYLGWELPAVNGVVPPLASGASGQVQFIPHHFITEIVPQPDVSKPQFPAACVAPLICSAGKYVYSGQPFDLRVKARNAADATTVNYDGRAKALMAPVTLQGLAPADEKIVFPPAAPAGSRLTDGSSAQTTVKEVALDKFTLGIATQSIAYRFPGAYAVPAGTIALAPPTGVRFRASSTYASGDVVSSGPAAPRTEGELTVLTGRIMVPNSYGSERLPIRLPVQVQYWNNGWLGNVSDSVTQFGHAGVTLANCNKGLTSGAGACNGILKVQDGTYVFKQGVLPPPQGQLLLLAPGVAGSVDVSVSGLPYLPSTLGRAVFGVFKSGPVIYLRELY
ncbi:polymer-forming cytoskeletal protein [Janthinobacterium sp. UMAB-56]|uniref:polymer-forming cytoskeletal protein n=1 Tax=Janthinobacterium sp. UMAB-56 TaxID=1365361 RepID=UPI001C59596F|nr:polymer-forming cytoskeletal protein [Janthinobacterium sp. UMAB-56]